MSAINLSNQTALVTGAASGIGRAAALALGRAGADLVICDVNQEGLAAVEAELRGGGRWVLARRVDVSSEDEMRAFAKEVHGQREALDILVNNAGVAVGGGLLHTTLEDWRWLLSINLWGVIHGCHFFVPAMVSRGRGGRVVNIASMAGFASTGHALAYCASKFAVLGLSEGLREELRPHGIGVSAICPGIINTSIVQATRMSGPLEERRDWLMEIFRRRDYGPEKVAASILQAIERGPAVLPVSPEAWFIYLAKRLSPSLVARLGRGLGHAVVTRR